MTQSINSKYVAVIDAIAEEHGSDDCHYAVPKNATLAQCIGYAQRYYVEGDEEHHRYNRCRNLLKTAMSHLLPNTSSRQTLLHMDVGAGPGLYSWVLRDYVRRNYPAINLKLYGYDRAPKMAKLANMIWERFNENVAYLCYHDENELYAAAMSDSSRPACVVLTLGYVLIQTDKDDSLKELASLCKKLSVNSKVWLVAIDAYSGDRPILFEDAWSKFVSILSNLRVSIKHTGSSQKVARIHVMSSPTGWK
ncbi:MAG: hypothetical protein OXF47_04890 [Nitrospira sp.]|nr:hypothetical protein [Nitrospira sp.]